MKKNPRDGLPVPNNPINWLRAWPVLLAIIILILNVEIIIMNILLRLGIGGWNLFFYGAILGNTELFIWVWLVGKIGIFIKENPGFRNFYNNLKSRGIDNLFRKTVKTVAEKLDPENKEYLDKIKRIRLSYFDLFLFGVCIGTWILGIIIFRATRRYDLLLVLMVGNTVKIALFAVGYSFLGWIFIPIIILTFIYKINKVFK